MKDDEPIQSLRIFPAPFADADKFTGTFDAQELLNNPAFVDAIQAHPSARLYVTDDHFPGETARLQAEHDAMMAALTPWQRFKHWKLNWKRKHWWPLRERLGEIVAGRKFEELDEND